jgi:EAL domain-containing protein (putative c-di-GMP-specific phosphodiesterase class I)
MRSQHSNEGRAVIKSIIDLGHSLGLLVTAEGIEDLRTFDNLKNLGCDLAQEYFIARPMSGAAMCAWTASRHLEPSAVQL